MTLLYEAVRDQVITGDLIAFKGRTLYSALVRFFTRSDYTHTGLAIWIEGGLWVAEIQLGASNHLTPLSQMTDSAFDVYECPDGLDRDEVRTHLLDSLRTAITYGLRSALETGILSWFKVRFRPGLRLQKTCSDYNLSVYRSSGWDVPDRMVTPRDLTDRLVVKSRYTPS
jgi:hypothetical protein